MTIGFSLDDTDNNYIIPNPAKRSEGVLVKEKLDLYVDDNSS